MNRLVWSLMLSLVAGCGVDAPSAQQEAALQPQAEVAQPPSPRFEVVAPLPSFRSQGSLQPQRTTVSAHSLAVADGTRVEFMLGVVSCGMLVVAHDTATVRGGAFEVPYDAALAEGFESVSLYFRVVGDDGAACDDTAQVLEAQVALPGSVDLSTAQATYAGCWVFPHHE